MFGFRDGENSQLKAMRGQIRGDQAPFLFWFWCVDGPTKIVTWWPRFSWRGVHVNARPFDWWKAVHLRRSLQASYMWLFVLSSWRNKMPQMPAGLLVRAGSHVHSHLFGAKSGHRAQTRKAPQNAWRL